MRVYEIPPKSTITIRIARKDMYYEMDAYIAGIRGNKVYLKLLRYKGQILNFESKNVQITVFYVYNGVEPLAWTGVTIRRETLGNSKYHVLICNKSSARVNRRGARRVNVTQPAFVGLKGRDKRMEITIVNVSLSGLSFMSVENIEDSDFVPIFVSFNVDENTTIQVTCGIMRRIPSDDDNYHFGAAIPKPPENWARYVNKLYKNNPEEFS